MREREREREREGEREGERRKGRFVQGQTVNCTLQEELLKERTKHQKHSSKRNEEFKLLIQEVS